tara:strand:- start:1089 stop:1274 length:186 start_codon:yes stop_codon:yes gene_type:complete
MKTLTLTIFAIAAAFVLTDSKSDSPANESVTANDSDAASINHFKVPERLNISVHTPYSNFV